MAGLIWTASWSVNQLQKKKGICSSAAPPVSRTKSLAVPPGCRSAAPGLPPSRWGREPCLRRIGSSRPWAARVPAGNWPHFQLRGPVAIMQHTRRLFLQSSRAREYQIRRSPSELIPYWKTSLTPVPTPRPSSSNGSRRISEPSRWRRRLYKGKITKQFESRFVDAPGCSGVVDSGR